jgi:hypothetical protein
MLDHRGIGRPAFRLLLNLLQPQSPGEALDNHLHRLLHKFRDLNDQQDVSAHCHLFREILFVDAIDSNLNDSLFAVCASIVIAIDANHNGHAASAVPFDTALATHVETNVENTLAANKSAPTATPKRIPPYHFCTKAGKPEACRFHCHSDCPLLTRVCY